MNSYPGGKGPTVGTHTESCLNGEGQGPPTPGLGLAPCSPLVGVQLSPGSGKHVSRDIFAQGI